MWIKQTTTLIIQNDQMPTICSNQIKTTGFNSARNYPAKQVAQLSLTNPRDALHRGKRQNFKTVT